MATILKFKTNINCGSCVKSVSGFLNDLKNVTDWEVDVQDSRKILTVKGEGISAKDIIDTVYDAGFDIEPA